MRLHKESTVASPKVSLILLDWSVRESFHICHYLRNQTVPRDQFEVIVLEYYSTLSSALLQFENDFDTIGSLDMPKSSCYHKHLMYNIGFLLSKGEIIVICDSDAMAKPTFIESIIKEFEKNPNIILHLDQFRNSRRDLYPFNYPTFEAITGEGTINFWQGVTKGIAATTDTLHLRNYGACFCCTREDFIAIGGADEHIDYVGHICGPYDLTFRLNNLGRTEVWHRKEFLYHTWHPGTDGINNYLGPHDGRRMSTTALEHIGTGRTLPHLINPLIKQIQEGNPVSSSAEVSNRGISPEMMNITNWDFLKNKASVDKKAKETYRHSSQAPALFYNDSGKPEIPGIHRYLAKGQCPSRTNSNNESPSASINLLHFIRSTKKTIETPYANSFQKKPQKDFLKLPYILFKAFLLLIKKPKVFANKFRQLFDRYQYSIFLLEKFPGYFQEFMNGLQDGKKTIIFAGNDLEVDFLKDLHIAIQMAQQPGKDKELLSSLTIEAMTSYADRIQGSNAPKCYFTKSAYSQLQAKKKTMQVSANAI